MTNATTTNANKSVKISNPERISRIFTKICSTQLSVFIRSNEEKGVVVKGVATRLSELTDEKSVTHNGVLVTGVSEKGVYFLYDKKHIIMEFVLMSTKVSCICEILQLRHTHVIFKLPKYLVSLERRSNARYKVTDASRAFVEFSLWQPKADDLLAPYVYDHQKHLSLRLGITDISNGGICVATKYPAIAKALERGMVDSEAYFYVPMTSKEQMALEIRWIKKIKAYNDAESNENAELTYNIGCQFQDINEQNKAVIGSFIQKIVEDDAI